MYFHFSSVYIQEWNCGLYGNSVFNCWRNLHAGFHGSCTISHSHQQYLRVLISSYPRWHLPLSIFFIQAIPVGVKWCLAVVLIYISLVANDIYDFFMCTGHFISSLKKHLFRPSIHSQWGHLSWYCSLQECSVCSGNMSPGPLCSLASSLGLTLHSGHLGGLLIAVGHPGHCGVFHGIHLPLEASSTPTCDNQNCPLGVRIPLREKPL